MKCPFKKKVEYHYTGDPPKLRDIAYTEEKYCECDEKNCPYYKEANPDHGLKEKCKKVNRELI